MRLWLCQVDRRTGLIKARSGDLPSFIVNGSGMGDSLAGPLFLLLAGEDPTGRTEAWADDQSGRCWSGRPTQIP